MLTREGCIGRYGVGHFAFWAGDGLASNTDRLAVLAKGIKGKRLPIDGLPAPLKPRRLSGKPGRKRE
jgi:hypothetical protein